MFGGSSGGNGTQSEKPFGVVTMPSSYLERSTRLWVDSTQFSTSRKSGGRDMGVSSKAMMPDRATTVPWKVLRKESQESVSRISDGRTAISTRQAKPSTRRLAAGL